MPKLPSCRSGQDELGSGAPLQVTPAQLQPRLSLLRPRLDRLSREIAEFWWPRGYDARFGGFHGSLDREGRPSETTEKSLVQQARHLWALSAFVERRGNTAHGHEPQALYTLAHGTRHFLSRFVDCRDGRYFWELDRAGALRDRRKVLYGQAFAIFGLSQYGISLKATEALDAALRCFNALESFCHDAHQGGYHEFGDPTWVTGGSEKDTNTHIHLMEAFTVLHDATRDPLVRQRLADLTELVCRRLLQAEGHVHPFFERDFSLFGRPRVSYGHDIETAWLLIDASRSLGWDLDTVREPSLRMGRHAVDFGFDDEDGGVFDEGVPGGAVTSFDKVWWAQFEALAGLWWLFRLTGDFTYVTRLERTLDWIEGPGRDVTFGEWYFGVARDRSCTGHGLDKGNIWKTTYHNLRATLFVADWIDAWENGTQGRTP